MFILMPKCVICGLDADMHHLYTRGARPDLKDKVWNQIPVYRSFHNLFHAKGIAYMVKHYHQVRRWMAQRGWAYDEYSKKWYHPQASEIIGKA